MHKVHRKLSEFLTEIPQHKPIKFSIQPFSKGWQGGGAAPLLAFRRKRNPPHETQKIRKGGQTSRWDVWPWGTLSRGSPQDAVLQSPLPQKKPRREKKRQTLRLAGAVFRFGWIRNVSCRNFFKIAAAGTSAGGLRAAFPYFWVAPEAQRGWISPSAEGEEGRCPSTLPAF